MNLMMNKYLGKNWKTTLTGILTLLLVFLSHFGGILPESVDVEQVQITILGIGTFFGLTLSQDGSKE